MGQSWRGRVAFVTGASRGIGFEVSRRLSDAGARVGMIARDADALESARRQLANAEAAPADVSEPSQVAEALAALETALGPPTVLVNNAGHGHWGAAAETPIHEFRRAITVNYLGVVHATSVVLPGMLRRHEGHIVNIASVAGRMAAPFESAYSASKFAVVGYSEALAVELVGTGVHVSLIDPGPVETEFFIRRGHPAHSRAPNPVSAGRVAEAIIKSVEQRRTETFLPHWLRLANLVKTALPPAYRAGAARMYARELRDLRDRVM